MDIKELLKIAIEDIYKARSGANCSICDVPKDGAERCAVESWHLDCKFKWRYETEAHELIGGEE